MEASRLIEAEQTTSPATECDLPQPCSVAAEIENAVASVAARHGLQAGFAENVPLLDQGFTSMGIVDIMLALEAAFKVEIPQNELTSDNFLSKHSVAVLMCRLLEGETSKASAWKTDCLNEDRRI